MAYQDNGLIDLSLVVSRMEMALCEYSISPQLGLEKLQVNLLSFQRYTSLETSFNDVFHERLFSLLSSVDHLLDSGAPYFKDYHIALMSACDAFFQIVVSSQFGLDRIQQLYFLLSIDRPCWVTLLATKQEINYSPAAVGYEAQIRSDDLIQDQTVDSLLKILSTVGRVSFSVDSIQDECMIGCFKLFSVQSIDWLQSRFSNFHWKMVEENENQSLKQLCELSFLPIFHNSSMARDARSRLLNLFEHQFKALFYRPFGSLFLPNSSIQNHKSRLVPAEDGVVLLQHDESLDYFPIRHCGFIYVASSIKNSGALNFSYLNRLGKDFLSCFLYEIKTGFGRFVFDLQECVGIYTVSKEEILIVEGMAWLKPKDGDEVELVLDFPISTLTQGSFCTLLDQIKDVLLINQAGRRFAVPFLTLRNIEGVSSQMVSPSAVVKNMWLSREGEPLIEPWLLSPDNVPKANLPIRNDSDISVSKNGYYHGVVAGYSFWIDTQLVSSIVPYRSPVSFYGNLKNWSFFIHEGRCFDNIVSIVTPSMCIESEVSDYAFSAILDWMDVSVVVSFEHCAWRGLLPEEHNVKDFDCGSVNVNHADQESGISALSGNLVVNKENYLSFVAAYLPASLLA